MGVKNLWDILESCKKTLPLHHLQNKRLCIDLSYWIVQLYSACPSPVCVREKLYLKNLFHRLRALIALNCNLIFVTDGSIPAIKLTVYRRRLGIDSEVTQDEVDSHLVPSLRRNKGSEFSRMIKEAKLLGTTLGIPCLDGVEEAEAQCAILNSASLCDGCLTADSDIFLFGARTVYRDIFLGNRGYVLCYDMIDIEQKLGLGRNSLIALALLLGSDYSPGVHGFGPETACQIVKSIEDDIILDRIVSEGLTVARKTKVTKKKGKAPNSDVGKEHNLKHMQNNSGEQNPGLNDQFSQVINAYLKPKCHSPDSEAVKKVCFQHPFQRTQFQEICSQFFGWDPDKSDQYILPKIAERDLRRFANFRSTSLDLGVQISLQEIPVTCPVLAIMKQRRLLGMECFEVSWQQVYGLKETSIVPADLVKSACPEKISEFMERKAGEKKQKRKAKLRKPEKLALAEVDLQLQGLLLTIESENDPFSDPTTSYHSAAPCNVVEYEVIDLSSPSPPLPAFKIAKFQKIIGHHIDVIKASSCETGASLPKTERESRQSNVCNVTECEEIINCYTDEIDESFLEREKDVKDSAVHNASEHEKTDVVDVSTPEQEKVRDLRPCGALDRCWVDVVDMSPRPLEYGRKPGDSSTCDVTQCEETVIDLCDSETDASPGHQRKARELRLFMDSIKSVFY